MARVHTTGEKVTRHDNTIRVERQPIKTTIYHKDTGDPLEVFVVDAREILAQPDSLYTASKEDLQPQQPSAVTETLGRETFGVGERGRPLGELNTDPNTAAKSDKSQSASTDETEDTRTKAELEDAAVAKGIRVKSTHTKADLLRLLEMDGLTKADLVQRAEAKGLDATGSKADLVNRLADAD